MLKKYLNACTARAGVVGLRLASIISMNKYKNKALNQLQ